MTLSANEPHFLPSRQEQMEIEQVMVELENLKRQSERLDLINKLHERMTGVLSVAGMIEAYSVWLMPLVSHELVGYSNSVRRKVHLFCSSHGPRRRQTIAFAEKLISVEGQLQSSPVNQDGYVGGRWIFETRDDAGILLILKRGQDLDSKEMDLLNHSLEILADSLQRGLEYEELFERASNDPLTGLSNRRVFDDRVPGMIACSRRYCRPLTMILMDLDRFKNINDSLGHQAGDEVLISVADVLTSGVRSTDLLVRFGGDEFVLVLEDTDLSKGMILAERLCRAVDGMNIWADEQIKLGISLGLAELKEGETLKQWLERADDILYNAKSEGRSRVAVS
ncbi:MAG: GGDEF domain-containing protein [Deltaproteobacteria bacterium]|nr:GGDEF domain-containing protein [Deltaproteobacteria bacterium]